MSNIKQRLEHDHNVDRLYGAYIIQTQRPESALKKVHSFIAKYMFDTEPPVTDDNFFHPDYMLISKEEKTAKNISVKQIRDLQSFVYKTSIVSGSKVGIILDADLMNSNSANCALKMLEDVPSHCIFFLISSNAASLLPTIKSRCALIQDEISHESAESVDLKNRLIEASLKRGKLEQHLGFIQEFASKDRALWQEMAASALAILAKFIQIKHGINTSFSEEEQRLFIQHSDKHLFLMQQNYDEMNALIKSTIEFDLDLRASTLLLLEKMK